MQAAAYVVVAGGLLRESDIPGDLAEVVRPMNGHSLIVGPDGEILTGPLLDEEGILTARANLGNVLVQKMIADHAGHYTRPDVFDFRVNRRSRQVARFDDGEAQELSGRMKQGVRDHALRTEGELAGAFEDLLRGR
jgi:nitrilase